MEAYKKIIDIEDNTLTLQLPKNFKSGKFEVIVLPVKPAYKNKKPSDYLRLPIKGNWFKDAKRDK